MSNAAETRAEADEASGPHLLDSTMFWSRNGVRGYLLAKRAWLSDEDGWRHTIVAPGHDDLPDHIACGGLRWPGLGRDRLPLRRRTLARLIERQAPDLIEAGDPYRLAWASLDAAQRLGVPSVAFCHASLAALVARLAGHKSQRDSWARRVAGAYLRRLYGEFDLVLAPSDALVRELRELGITRVQRQSLGVDGTTFHPGRRDPAWRDALGIGADTRVLMYAGRFAPEKNLALLGDVVRRLGPRYRLLALGSGPAPPRGRQVRLLPYEPRPHKLARALAGADVFVHAGDEEAFGRSTLQAMACGTPAVVRAAGALPEVVAGGAGLAVRSLRADDWVEAISAVFAAGRASWAATARARAAEHEWSAVLPALLRRYRGLLDGTIASSMTARASFGEATQPAIAWHTPIGARRKDAL